MLTKFFIYYLCPMRYVNEDEMDWICDRYFYLHVSLTDVINLTLTSNRPYLYRILTTSFTVD